MKLNKNNLLCLDDSLFKRFYGSHQAKSKENDENDENLKQSFDTTDNQGVSKMLKKREILLLIRRVLEKSDSKDKHSPAFPWKRASQSPSLPWKRSDENVKANSLIWDRQ